MVFFAIGYMVIWLLIMGYTAIIHQQQVKLKRELVILEELVQEQK